MNRSVSEEDAGRFCGWMVVVRTRVLAFPGEGEVTKKAELSSEDAEGIFYGSESSGRRQVCTMYGNEMNASFYIVIQSNI